MRTIDKILEKLEHYVNNKVYLPVETDQLELKDLSGGDNWQELYKTICAFLNTKGGIIIIGIKEDTKGSSFKFTGFSSTQSTEEKIKNISNLFTDKSGIGLDLSDFINPNLTEIKPFLDGNICLIFVEKLPEDKKYVFYKGSAYERQLTGDHKIREEKILKQEELVEELRNAVELELVPDVTIDDLDVDKLNDYIIRLNSGKKVETTKEDISSALSFLSRKKFIRDNNPTLLGMLVCGKQVFDHLKGKCELDAYFEIHDTIKTIADDKKLYKDNIIPLMEDAISFVYSKINIGIIAKNGGSSVWEYPEDVVRESINNALAHRDYTSDRFSILRIKRDEYIEIRNPGKFRQEQMLYSDETSIRLRRIVPIVKIRNANLAEVLNVYNRWEGRGIGMSTLINYALSNIIDVPYFKLYHGYEIGLFIPKGKVLDEKVINQFNNFDKYIKQKTNNLELTKEQQTVLAYFYKSEKLNSVEKYTVNLTPDNNHFDVISDLLSWRLIEKLPQSTPELQLYRIDPVLKKEDFTTDLIEVFGSGYLALSQISKDILQAIYLHNEYKCIEKVNANFLGNYLYFKSHNSSQIDIDEFKKFNKKLRNEIKKLERMDFIVRKNERKPNYEIKLPNLKET